LARGAPGPAEDRGLSAKTPRTFGRPTDEADTCASVDARPIAGHPDLHWKLLSMRRLARPEDLEAVFAIYSHPKVVPYLTYEPMTLEAFRPIHEELVDSGYFWVWELDGAIAGFYRATRYPGRVNHVLLLGTLAVDPARHGQGVGRTMIEDALSHFRADGIRRVELYAESDNEPALAFYRRLGFVIEGTLRDFYKRADQPHYVDEHVLGLLLVPSAT
jgi:putative acetyltransferase